MIQPTQDTDITSSISPLFHVRDDDICEKLIKKNNVKKLLQGKSPTSFIMETVYSEELKSQIDETAKYQNSDLLKSLGENFPWLIKFSKVIQSAVGSKNAKLLDRLLFVYIENMLRDVNTCYTKPYRAAKLKAHMSETLIFFHLYWKNIKERVDDHNHYLDKMSEILAMYIDMELKASRRGKDSSTKIAAKLLTALFIYLDNSEEQIFRVLFRVKFITKNYSDICHPIFTKLLSGLTGSVKCITDVTYVRYLLALKLWKRIKDKLQEKKKINELGIAILGHKAPLMNPELAKIIPKPPDFQKSGTLWLLQPNSFDLRKACDSFIKYELSEHILSLPDPIENFKIMDSTDIVSSAKVDMESIDGLQQEEILEQDNFVAESQEIKKVVKLRRFKPSFPKLRPGEVVFIDLTAETEENKQRDGKKKKKKDKKKLKWLKEVKRKLKLKKECRTSDKIWIEKVAAHSTEDNIEEIKRTSTNWPISEDKVTESTERNESAAVNVHKFGKQEKNECNLTVCKGCKFCNFMGNRKYLTTDRQGSSENLVTSQTSPINNNAIVVTNDTYMNKELYFNPDSFGEAGSGNDLINCIKQEHKNTASYSSKTISEPHSFSNAKNQTEHEATVKMIKQELQDVIDDSTTDKNCDKIIITDSSSFNINQKTEGELFIKRNASLSVMKLETGDIMEANAAIPSKISTKNTILSLTARGKLSRMKERNSESCVVSTTVSIADFDPSNETLNSNIRVEDFKSREHRKELDSNVYNNLESQKKETLLNSKKLILPSKINKSAEMSKNSSGNVPGETVNNKLQHNLIHALSLDEVIQIGKDDIDSQSEDEEEKGCCSKTMNQEITENRYKKSFPGEDNNDFFQIPDMQLCDDLTNDSDIGNLVTTGSKSKIDDFENIDILDSILNGDMSMQDILEEQQHLSMSSTSNDTSANMLGFFTEFFKQSEATQSAKELCTTDETSHLDEVTESLPEGSLGTTGILNSLLDSDLTSMDSPPSDFMYSNVQTVDPRLIRKSPTAERATFISNFSVVSDLFSQNEQSLVKNFGPVDSLSKKTKDQLFLDQKDSLNSTDLEEFGLNSSEQDNFEMPVLEEELIQLPQDPLIDETIITQISPQSCESPLSTQSEIENLHEVKSTLSSCVGSQDFNNIQFPENTYDYSKINNFKDFTSLRLKDIMQQSISEIKHNEDLPTSTLTDFTPPQSVDPPQSPYTFVSSPAPLYNQTIPHSPTHSIGTSRNNVSANMLTPPPSMPQLIRQNNLTPPPTPQHSKNCHTESLNGQQSPGTNSAIRNLRGRTRSTQNKSQAYLFAGVEDSSLQQQDSILSLKNKECNETERQKSQTKLMYVVRSKKNTKLKVRPNEAVDLDNQDQSLHLAQVQVALTRLTREEINARSNGEQSLLKSKILLKREMDSIPFNVTTQAPQLQRIDLRKLGIAAPKNKSVFINLNGKTKPALVLERNIQTDKLLKSLQDDVNSQNNIVYKLTSNVNPATSKDKPYSKLPKVNFTIQNQTDLVTNTQSTVTTRCDSRKEVSKSQVQKIMRPRSSSRRIKTQTKKSTKELNIEETLSVPNTEEPSLKKRKITPKLVPLLENEGIIYSVNQQKAQEKHTNVIRREFNRKDRMRKKVV